MSGDSDATSPRPSPNSTRMAHILNVHILPIPEKLHNTISHHMLRFIQIAVSLSSLLTLTSSFGHSPLANSPALLSNQPAYTSSFPGCRASSNRTPARTSTQLHLFERFTSPSISCLVASQSASVALTQDEVTPIGFLVGVSETGEGRTRPQQRSPSRQSNLPI